MDVYSRTALVALVIGALGFMALFFMPSPSVPSSASVPHITSRISVTPGVERWYTNNLGTFSFLLPDGFTAPDIETGESGVTGAVVQFDGIEQLLVLVYETSPIKTLSVTGIEEILGVSLVDVKEVFIGTVVRGMQFQSDDGFEVWAIHNGRLYRILASPENEDLLDFILGNWYFAPPSPTVRK